MEYINISHKRAYDCKIHAVSSEQHESLSVFNILSEAGHWSSRKSDENMPEYIVIDFSGIVTINVIEMEPASHGSDAFPIDFRFEVSLDGEYWMVLHEERSYEPDGETYRLDLPLTPARYLKILITANRRINGKYYSEIGRFRAGIAGAASIDSSSSASKDHSHAALLDGNPDTWWESGRSQLPQKEWIRIDLGALCHINRIILASHEEGFPEHFSFETSPDGDVWKPLLEEKSFKAQERKKYFWNTPITPARYLRIEARGVPFRDGSCGVRISGLEISAAPFNPFHTHNTGELTPYASIFQAGIVKLAKDGDDAPGTALQANDRRLREATIIFPGIVRLAADGETADGAALQSSDSRIKPATDIRAGIVRLAYDREVKAGAVVQSNDSRLQEATEESFGIVKLCPNGIYRENAVVTGNDERLQKAGIDRYGICILAEDRGVKPGTVVQANDSRIKLATTLTSGIVELAEDGEDAPNVVVQGNDRRLKDATTKSKGIVELAENGEDAPNVAVQGNDRRLKDATTKIGRAHV